jgi:hypothetical protein
VRMPWPLVSTIVRACLESHFLVGRSLRLSRHGAEIHDARLGEDASPYLFQTRS